MIEITKQNNRLSISARHVRYIVIPANAGNQIANYSKGSTVFTDLAHVFYDLGFVPSSKVRWFPAFAGMTM